MKSNRTVWYVANQVVFGAVHWALYMSVATDRAVGLELSVHAAVHGAVWHDVYGDVRAGFWHTALRDFLGATGYANRRAVCRRTTP